MNSVKRITADLILDLYLEAKKNKGLEREKIMKKVIFLSKHLNERMDLKKVTAQ